MASDEFDIIHRHFNRKGLAFAKRGVALGIGDDCALLTPDPAQQLCISMDMLQEGVHFLPGADPFLLGQRTLLVNLSDLAAMGAEPLCFTLGVSLPRADELWLERFSAGLASVALAHDCPLVGGDLTAAASDCGALTLCVQVHGQRPADSGMRRSGAQPGDHVYVTGTLGDAAAGLAVLKAAGADLARSLLQTDAEAAVVAAFQKPESRVKFGMAVRNVASAAIDISDGLASDLGHIVASSNARALIDTEALPMSDAFRTVVTEEDRLAMALSGGDDYELCFTVPPERVLELEQCMKATDTPATCIGHIEAGEGIRWLRDGAEIALKVQGYNHFSRQHTAQEKQ